MFLKIKEPHSRSEFGVHVEDARTTTHLLELGLKSEDRVLYEYEYPFSYAVACPNFTLC